VIVEQASAEDAQEILDLQKLAYRSEAELYDDFAIAPLIQTLNEMREDIASQLVLKICDDQNRIVGSIRGYLDRHTCRVGRLIVHPDRQNQGIGTRLMEEMEQRFAGARRYELFTGHRSEKNLRLYRRLGYTVVSERPVTESLTLVFMEKPGKT
jgi:ribosomal protein S18 acetylase RimI-like enzyme